MWAISSDGNVLATFKRNTIHLWDARTARTGTLNRTIHISGPNPDEIVFSSDARRFVVISREQASFVDTTTGSIFGSLPKMNDAFVGHHFFSVSPFRRPPPTGP